MQRMTPLSVLDLSPIVEGGDAAQSFRNTRDLAQHAERWGYKRYWLAEHHNMTGVASAATAVIIGHVAQATTTIRVGAGGVMLPNHAPLVIAEQFGTLASLYPHRIDLGLGRAPGSTRPRAPRRNLNGDIMTSSRDVIELMTICQPSQQLIRAVPGAGWMSFDRPAPTARNRQALGLPYAFASHFAPAYLDQALALYRSQFRPSEHLDRPHVMAGVNVVAAETDAEANGSSPR